MRYGILALPVLLFLGCSDGSAPSAPAEDADGPDDSFLIGGKADAYGVSDDSEIACAIRRVANESELSVLMQDVGLVSTAAKNIVAFRQGPDGELGTRDDGWFFDLSTLDAVPWVGRVAFTRLKEYAQAHAQFACGEVDVQLLAFNDFHGHLQPPAGFPGMVSTGTGMVPAGGAAYLAALVATKKAENPNTLIVSSGDVIGGSPLVSSIFHDEPTIEAMNLLGLSVAAVGNHEFDEGLQELLRMQQGGCHPVDGCANGSFEGARFDYLGANVVLQETGSTLFPSYSLRSFRGARVAFVGITTKDTPSVTTAEGSAGLLFQDEVETVERVLPELAAQKVHAVVLLLHEGGKVTGDFNGCASASGPLFEIAKKLPPQVDVVLGGHTHAGHVCWIDGRLVSSASSFGRLLTDVDLRIDERTGRVTSIEARNEIVRRNVPGDPQMSALIEKYEALAAPIANREVGEVTENITRAASGAGDCRLGSLAADAQVQATGADVALMNPGGLRADLIAHQSASGEPWGTITFAEAFAVHPFGNELVTVVLTGAQILAALEQQWVNPEGGERKYVLSVSEGFTYRWDPERLLGQRVVPGSVMLRGTPLDPNGSYRVALNDFLASGGDGFSVLGEWTESEAGGVDLDALLAYLAAHSPVAAPAMGRVQRL